MLSALIICGGHYSSDCEHGDGRRRAPYLEFGGVWWASPKMASMPLLRLWFSQLQGRHGSDVARALGKGDVAVEASATGILEEEEEQGKLLGGLPSPRSPREVVRAGLDSRWCPLPLQVGPAHPSPENQFGVSHYCSESQQRLPGRPS